jgi:hypothetical protein
MTRAAELHFDAVLDALLEATRDVAWALRLRTLARTRDRDLHVAVMHEPYLSLLLEGEKTIESRFSIKRIQPFERVAPGDVLALKRQSGPVVGLALVAEARFYELDPAVIEKIRGRYAAQIAATDDGFWRDRKHASYATLIAVTDPHRLGDVPVNKRDRRGWATLVAPGPLR